jgi:hypothetical protein
VYQYVNNVKGYTFFITMIGLWGSLFLTTPQIGLGMAFGETSTGLDFPGSAAVTDGETIRFKFTDPHTNGLPPYGDSGAGVTYIWRYYPRQQAGYYTTFFWGNDDGVGTIDTYNWYNGGSNTHYGSHPYPQNPPNGNTHFWEISTLVDVTNGTVEYERWHLQALRVWGANGAQKEHHFYWDLPNVDASHIVVNQVEDYRDWGNVNPPFPALTFGDAPWQPGQEVNSGILRGIQIYSGLLTTSEILSEANAPLSTAAGANNIWYLNMNPTPTDISDKSGKGHNPSWVGSERPALYSDTSSSDTTPPAPPTGLQLQEQ